VKLQKINELVQPIVESEGFEFVGAELNQGGYRHRLIIFVDKPGTPINLDECAMLSRRMSAILDVEGVLTENAYVLEVSSPGIDRPLFTQAQIAAQVGKRITLQLKTPIEGRKNFKGLLVSADETQLTLQIEKDDKTQTQDLVIDSDEVTKAKLCESENILNKSLSKNLRKDRKRGNANEL
jgi:ribosome maturation factor RimP